MQETPKTSFHWLSALQVIFSVFGALSLLGLAAITALSGGYQLVRGAAIRNLDASQSFLMASGLLLGGLLILPSAWYGIKRLTSQTTLPGFRWEWRRGGLWLSLLLVLVMPAVLFLGNLVSTHEWLSWTLLPLFNVIAVGLPVMWLVYMGMRGLPAGSLQRVWGLFASGVALGPTLILIVEFTLLGLGGGLLVMWIAVNPAQTRELNDLYFRLSQTVPTEEAILRITVPYLLRPGVLATILTFMAVLVPLIEETLKVIGMWFIAGRGLSAAEGFVAGLLSGAAFAMFENFGNTSLGGEVWAVMSSIRVTTALLHVLTSGLVGWALASAWSQGRYLRLLFTFSLAVGLHGIWNAMSILGIGALEVPSVSVPPVLKTLSTISVGGLAFLTVINLCVYLGFNARLRRVLRHEQAEEGIEGPDITTEPGEGDATPPSADEAAQTDSQPALGDEG